MPGRRTFVTMLLPLFVTVWPALAVAALTPITPCTEEPDLIGDWNLIPPDQDGHEGVLGYLYGWANVTRVDDFGAPTTDQWWRGTAPGGGVACARGIWAGNVFDFGWLDPGDGFHVILPDLAGGDYIDPLEPRNFLTDGPGPFRFAINCGATPNWTSCEQDNGGEDHMVTFRISGNADEYGRDYSHNPVGDYVVAWEDMPFGVYEREYNDLIVQVHGAAPYLPSSVVPEPCSGLLLAGGLLLLLRRWQRPGAHSK